MDNSLGQQSAALSDGTQIEIIESLTSKKDKKEIIISYVYIVLFLLIPVLSIEGIVGWALGISGAYKIINIYRSSDEKKNKKSTRLLIRYLLIAVVYNITIYFIQKFVVSKTV